jgi:hypothetical protein
MFSLCSLRIFGNSQEDGGMETTATILHADLDAFYELDPGFTASDDSRASDAPCRQRFRIG